MDRDIRRLLDETTPMHAAAIDLGSLHRRGARRRTATRLATGAVAVSVLAVGVVGVQALRLPSAPTVGPAGPGPSAPGPAETDSDEQPNPSPPTDEPANSEEERQVQACMEDAGLRYDLTAEASPPAPAYTITPSTLTGTWTVDDSEWAERIEAAQELGWLGYELGIAGESSVAPEDATEPTAHHQQHFEDEVEREAQRLIEEQGTTSIALYDIELYTDYLDAMVGCQEEAYGYEVWTLEQHRAVKDVVGTSWSPALTTGVLGQDPEVQEALSNVVECRVDAEGMRRALDEAAMEAGLADTPGSAAGWSLALWAEVDAIEVPEARRFADATRADTLQHLECQREYHEVVGGIAVQKARDYLARHSEDLQQLGIEVDLETE